MKPGRPKAERPRKNVRFGPFSRDKLDGISEEALYPDPERCRVPQGFRVHEPQEENCTSNNHAHCALLMDHIQDRNMSVAIKGRILPFSSTSDATMEVKSNGMRCDH